ncbi:MAG: hypothetical protein K1000chlam3_00847 [Chlamydiae bacterium]|nr:hypothetical protein [Chlamydiota bacterium]
MGKIFKRGLIALAPVAISIAIIIWLLGTLESVFRVPLEWLAGEYYFPGMGLLVAIIFIFFFGIIVNNFLIQKMTGWMDKLFVRIPLFKTIYNSIGDMMSYFQPKDKEKRGKMVQVEVGGLCFLAIMTREDFSDLPEGFAGEDDVAIFIPFSYQIGGFTATVPRSKIKLIDMTVEQGMRFMVTAGMISGKNQKNAEKKQ